MLLLSNAMHLNETAGFYSTGFSIGGVMVNMLASSA
jgi:hypothetical protein